MLTALIERLGYAAATEVAKAAAAEKKTVREIILARDMMDENEFDELVSPERVMSLGHRLKRRGKGKI